MRRLARAVPQRLGEDGAELGGFGTNGVQFRNGSKACLGDEVQPIDAFFGFLDDDAEFGDEFGTRPGSAGSAIVRSDRRGTFASCLATTSPDGVRGNRSISCKPFRQTTWFAL